MKNRLWTAQLGVIVNFKYLLFKGIFLLVKYVNGSLGFIQGIFGLFIGSYISNFFLFFRKLKFNLLGWSFLNIFLQKYIFINHLSSISKKKNYYTTSNGCYSQLLNCFYDLNLVKVKLSSGRIKLLSGNTLCVLGRNSNIFYKYSIFGGYKWSFRFGWKYVVRGVAMNPVDHPHGGRTKTNKPEVSPWNWIAKQSH